MAAPGKLGTLALGSMTGGDDEDAPAGSKATAEPEVTDEQALAGEEFGDALKSGDGKRIFAAFRDLKELCAPGSYEE